MTYQITQSGTSENTKQDKYQPTNKSVHRHVIVKLKKIKNKNKIQKSQSGREVGGTNLPTIEQG